MPKFKNPELDTKNNSPASGAENYFDTDKEEVDNLQLKLFAEGEEIVVKIEAATIQPTKSGDKLGLLLFLQGDEDYRTIVYWCDVSFMSRKFSANRPIVELIRGKESLINILSASGSDKVIADFLEEGSDALTNHLAGRLLVVTVKEGEYNGEKTNNVGSFSKVTDSHEIPENLSLAF